MSPIRVLSIEDSSEDTDIVIEELRQGGFEVICRRVETPADLHRALRNGNWDVVLSDYSMPRLNGLKAASMVRRHSPELPIIFVSGVIGEKRAVEAMRAGVCDYVSKNNLGRLAAAVNRELRRTAERNQAQQSLQEAKEYASSIVASIHMPLVILDGNMGIRSVNPAFEQAFNWLAGRSSPQAFEALLELIPQKAQVIASVKKALRSGEHSSELEIEIELPERRLSYLVSSQAIEPSRNGSEGRVLLVMHDVTERKALERRMIASQRLEAVGRLANNIAHDFNNLLTVIGGRASLLESSSQCSATQDTAQIILAAVNRASRLTRQLMAFSRQQAQDLSEIRLDVVVERIKPILRSLVDESIDISFQLNGQSDLVRADLSQLEQIVVNLAVNARDAIIEGGKIVIRTSCQDMPQGRILHQGGGVPPGSYAILEVSDTGTGMSQEVLDRIFEPFFTTKEPGKGTGLGLSTVYGIVQQNRGYIRVESKPDQGTRFKVYFPAIQADSGSEAAEQGGASD